MISKTEQLAIDQGRKFGNIQQFQKMLRRLLPENLKIRFADLEPKGTPEAELVIAILVQAWADGDKDFFLNPSSFMGAYCKIIDIDPNPIRKDFELHNKPYFFATHKG